MEHLWNNAELPLPPLKTVPVKDINFDILKLRIIVQNAIDFLECQINFHENTVLCSKLITKRKNSFKHFKGFQHMNKAKTALNRLEKVNLPNILKNFIGLLPESVFSLELPPKANLDYVLLRVIGYYKILCRVTICCKYAVVYFVKILRNNFFMETLSLFLSVLSKIWYDGNIIAEFTTQLYNNLKKYLLLMPRNKIKHDFDDFIYPDKLNDNEDAVRRINKETQNNEKQPQKPVFIMKRKIQKPPIFQNTNSFINNQSFTDTGEVINREDFLIANIFEKETEVVIQNENTTFTHETTEKFKVSKIRSQNNKYLSHVDIVVNKSGSLKRPKTIDKNKKTKKNFEHTIKADSCLDNVSNSFNHIKTVDEIKKFLNDESAKRKSKTSLSKNISNKEWAKFQKVILYKMKCGKEKSCIQIFKKFLNKKS